MGCRRFSAPHRRTLGFVSKHQNNPDPGRIRVRLEEPGELIASLPHMLSFRPADSIVLLAGAGPAGKEIGKRMRCDLPAPEHVEALAAQLAESITIDDPPSVVVIIVGEGPVGSGTPPLPHRSLVDAIRRELHARGVDQPAALWVPEIRAGARWRCYDHLRCGGSLPDPKETVVAAETVGLGVVTYDSREDLERLLLPDSDLLLRERARLIDTLMRELRWGTGRAWSVERGLEVVREALQASSSGLVLFSDEKIAELGVALSDVRVRDACLYTALPPDSDTARAAAALWQALARALPAPERADAACLAGYAAYVTGNGALAGIALEAALAADGFHVLAGLLLRALQGGVEPSELHELATGDGESLWSDLEFAAELGGDEAASDPTERSA